MDERLEAGRHHLQNGERALQQGYPDDARAFFRAALLQFRGPELRLGEAHALRGLGQLDLSLGDEASAETLLRQAIVAYTELLEQLEAIDPGGLSPDMRAQAKEGLIASRVLLAEVYMRGGQGTEAREELVVARRVAERLGSATLVADVLTTLGRVALRHGHLAEAEQRFREALDTYRESANVEGEVGAWLLLAELARLRGDPEASRETLAQARPLAEAAHSARLLGRVLFSQGSVEIVDGDPEAAREAYEQALPLLREAGDREMQGYTLLGLGEIASMLGRGSALEHLVDGARMLGALGHRHGVASALVRIGEHGLRIDEPELALAASEAARRLWMRADPVQGVGQALRFITKSLAALGRWRATLLAAVTREAVAGRVQPNAAEVADYYRARAPQDWQEPLQGLSSADLSARTAAVVGRILEPVLEDIELEPEALDSVSGALAAVEALAARLPSPSPPADDEIARPDIEPASPMAGAPHDEEQHTGTFPALGPVSAGSAADEPDEES